MSSRQAIFKKTNYLKTNLLKQIKKISTLGSISIIYLSILQNYLLYKTHTSFFGKKCLERIKI